MRELTVNEVEFVDGGAIPVAVWVGVTLGSAAIGAVGGWLGASSTNTTTTVEVHVSCTAES